MKQKMCEAAEIQIGALTKREKKNKRFKLVLHLKLSRQENMQDHLSMPPPIKKSLLCFKPILILCILFPIQLAQILLTTKF